jgi:hypothetical protein
MPGCAATMTSAVVNSDFTEGRRPVLVLENVKSLEAICHTTKANLLCNALVLRVASLSRK